MRQVMAKRSCAWAHHSLSDMSEELVLADNQEASADVPPPPPTWRLRVVQISTVVIVLAAVGAAYYFKDHIQELAPYGYAAVFLTSVISNATVVLPVPGLAVTAVLAGILNPWIVGVVGGVAQALGELTGYMAGYSSQTWVDENPTYDRLAKWMQRRGLLTIAALAAIPNPAFDVAGIAAGALRLPVWKFLVGCAIGGIIKNTVFALLGYYGIETVSSLFGG
jgi:membrane protein YqaA with SNARE-associated domain